MARTQIDVHVYPPKEFLWAFVLIGLSLFLIGYSGLSSIRHPSLIIISASGSVSANPSQAVINLLLNATGNTSASAANNLSTIARGLNSTLIPFLGGNGSLVQTLSYSILPVSTCQSYQVPSTTTTVYPPTTIYCQPTLKFYAAIEYVTVTLPNVGNANNALLQISRLRGVGISNVAAKLSQQQQLNMSQQAIALALSNATTQAKLLSSGKQLSIQNITVQSSYYYPYNYGAASAIALNQTFFAGRATVTKSIYVVFSAS